MSLYRRKNKFIKRKIKVKIMSGYTMKRKRHYKKDSMYLNDLYTLTFDEDDTLESLDAVSKLNRFSSSTWSELFIHVITVLIACVERT